MVQIERIFTDIFKLISEKESVKIRLIRFTRVLLKFTIETIEIQVVTRKNLEIKGLEP